MHSSTPQGQLANHIRPSITPTMQLPTEKSGPDAPKQKNTYCWPIRDKDKAKEKEDGSVDPKKARKEGGEQI